MANYPHSELPILNDDLHRLLRALRLPGKPAMRAKAAQALGELGDLEAVESLVRSTLEDPEESVQTAAYDALTQLLGNTADSAITSYRAAPPAADAWIEPTPAGELSKEAQDSQDSEDAGMTGEEKHWEAEEMDGLLAVLRSNASEEVRLRAITALKTCGDARAADALADVARWGEGETVRRAAKDALEDLVGENLTEVLPAVPEDEYDDEEEEEDGDQEDEDDLDSDDSGEEDSTDENESEDSSAYQPVSASDAFPDSPLIQEGNPAIKWLLILVLILVVAAIVLYFISH